jgi:hypothetical protein
MSDTVTFEEAAENYRIAKKALETATLSEREAYKVYASSQAVRQDAEREERVSWEALVSATGRKVGRYQ